MAGRGRPKVPLTVSDADREVLVRWSTRPTSPHSIAQRARIVLLAADGLSNNEVADEVGVNQATVVKWRKRFIERGLAGLPDVPRPGAPRSIGDDDVEAVIVRTLEDKPIDATHWSRRDLAAKVGMSPSSVGRIWRAFGLKPWLTDTATMLSPGGSTPFSTVSMAPSGESRRWRHGNVGQTATRSPPTTCGSPSTY